MILSTPNHLLRFYLDATVTSQLLFAASWVDYYQGVTLSSIGGSSLNTTPITIVPAPAEGVKRHIHEVSIYNPNIDAVTVTLETYNTSSSTSYIHKKHSISSKQTLQYTENGGWSVAEVDVAQLQAKISAAETNINQLQQDVETIPKYTYINPEQIDATEGTGLQLRYLAPSGYLSGIFPPTPPENRPFLVVETDGSVSAYSNGLGWNELSAHYYNTAQNHWNLSTLNSNYVNTSGDTMTGALVISTTTSSAPLEVKVSGITKASITNLGTFIGNAFGYNDTSLRLVAGNTNTIHINAPGAGYSPSLFIYETGTVRTFSLKNNFSFGWSLGAADSTPDTTLQRLNAGSLLLTGASGALTINSTFADIPTVLTLSSITTLNDTVGGKISFFAGAPQAYAEIQGVQGVSQAYGSLSFVTRHAGVTSERARISSEGVIFGPGGVTYLGNDARLTDTGNITGGQARLRFNGSGGNVQFNSTGGLQWWNVGGNIPAGSIDTSFLRVAPGVVSATSAIQLASLTSYYYPPASGNFQLTFVPQTNVGAGNVGLHINSDGFALNVRTGTTASLALRSNKVALAADASISWTNSNFNPVGTDDFLLVRDALRTLALRPGTGPLSFRIYNTWNSNLVDYERVGFNWDSNIFKIQTEASGTGLSRQLVIGTSGVPRMFFSGTGHRVDIGGDLDGAAGLGEAFVSLNGYGNGSNNIVLRFYSHSGWTDYRIQAGINKNLVFTGRNSGQSENGAGFDFYCRSQAVNGTNGGLGAEGQIRLMGRGTDGTYGGFFRLVAFNDTVNARLGDVNFIFSQDIWGVNSSVSRWYRSGITEFYNTKRIYAASGFNTSATLLDLSATWNTPATPTAIKLNIVDTSSNAASLLMDLQTASTSVFKVAKSGSVTISEGQSITGPNNINGAYGRWAITGAFGGGRYQTNSTGYFSWSPTSDIYTSPDTILSRVGPGVISATSSIIVPTVSSTNNTASNMIVGSALLATTNSFLNYTQPYIWGYKTTQTSVSAVKGCYTEFMTIPFSSLFNGGGLLELEIQENSPRHTSSKFIIPMSYDDSNNSVIRRILPISTQGRRNSSPSGYGSGEVALEFYKDVSSNFLIFRLRSVGDTDQTGSLQTNILVKNFHGDVSFSNVTGIDTSNYNYSIYRLTPLTQNKSNVGINISEPSATLHVNGNVLVESSVSAKNSFILAPALLNSVTPPADGFGLVLRNQSASPYIAGGLVSFRNTGLIFQDGQAYIGTTGGTYYTDFYQWNCLKTRSDFGIGWSNNTDAKSSPDLTLFRDAANTLAQRNSTNAQTFRIYNTYTAASSFERAAFNWNASAFEIETEAAGAGLARHLILGTSGIPRISISSTGSVLVDLPTNQALQIGSTSNNHNGIYLWNFGTIRAMFNPYGLRFWDSASIEWGGQGSTAPAGGDTKIYRASPAVVQIASSLQVFSSTISPIVSATNYLGLSATQVSSFHPTDDSVESVQEYLDLLNSTVSSLNFDGPYVNVSGDTMTGDLSGTNIYLTGTLAAATKSFLIDHPTKPNKKLQYACLEGPENSVYVRGKVTSNIIELPEYWTGLVHEDSISVNLTPIGHIQPDLRVSHISDNKVYLKSESAINAFYIVYGTRKDVPELEVEF